MIHNQCVWSLSSGQNWKLGFLLRIRVAVLNIFHSRRMVLAGIVLGTGNAADTTSIKLVKAQMETEPKVRVISFPQQLTMWRGGRKSHRVSICSGSGCQVLHTKPVNQSLLRHKTIYWMGENIYKWCNQEGLNFQDAQRPHTTQQQHKKTYPKIGRRPK